MRTSSRIASLLVLLPVLGAGCAADPDPIAATAESEQTSANNCSFIPGCKDLREANEGPFWASVTTSEEAGKVRRRLAITYRESLDSSFLLCDRFPAQPPLSLVFVIGPEHARTSVTRAMRVSCPRSWGDNGGSTNTAMFVLVDDEDPELWDTLFPPGADGSRWYALQVAASNAHGTWDSRHGADYRLVLRPR